MKNVSDLIPPSDSPVELGQRLFREFFVVFSKLWIPVQLALAVVGLVTAIYYGSALRRSLLHAHRSVATIFAAKLEPTRNVDQGILAFVLSGVKDDWAKVDHLNPRELTLILDEIESKVRKSADKAARQRTLRAGDVIDKLGLEVIPKESTEPRQNWQAAIVSQRKESFITVPALSLRRKSINDLDLEGAGPNRRARLIAVLEHNPEILFDLELAAELELTMRRLDKASGDKVTVVQTYFLTESGVFLIRASGVTDQGTYYSNQFKPYTQHLDRPYFWKAVDGEPRKPTPFDYGTKPYLDLGGNGFVVTFSKKYDLPNRRVGVLCVDAKLPDEVTGEIKKHLQDLGAKVSDFSWQANTGVESSTGPLPEEFSWFELQMRKINDAQSEVAGRIATEPTSKSPTQTLEGGDVVRFTVPVGSHEYEKGIKKTRFLGVEFNPNSILKNLTTNLALFTGGITLVIGVTFSLFWDYTRLKREMSNVLEKMANVMRDAATPFVWLDEKNEFVKVNRSMLMLLGHRNIDELKRQSPTFRGLVTDETQHIYDVVLETSGAGEETGEYKISIITKSGEVLDVRAHGERIPYPTWWRRGLPHRFGIFVEVTQPSNSPQAEPTRS